MALGLRGAEPAISPAWFAIRVKPRHEKVTAHHLHSRGLEEFLPLYRSSRQWSDRTQVVELPLFDGYLFCRFSRDTLIPVLSAPGVLYVVSHGVDPAPVEEDEIAAIRRLVESRMPIGPWPYLREGQRVRICCGALKGLEGVLVHLKGQSRVVVSVHLLQRSVAADVDRETVEPVL